MDIALFEAQIRKTGFVLEDRLAQELRAAHWTVISSKYYVDDAEETVREIDLVAYQAAQLKDLDIYTVLIISCKKSEANAWSLLARQIDLRDPNSDWWPLHAWSNVKALRFQLQEPGATRRYHEQMIGQGVVDALATPAVDVFAFQEMTLTTGAPQDDRKIFAAVTSLMKAQAYELGALPQRKKRASVYQFNLLSVVDAELVRLMFTGGTIAAAAVDSEHYIARYIVHKQETFSRIRFIRADAFTQALPDYGRLHQANTRWFVSERDSFFLDVVTSPAKLRVFLEEFRREVGWHIRWSLERHGLTKIEPSDVSLYWNAESARLEIQAPIGDEGAALLNEDNLSRKHSASALKRIYRYEGAFIFKDDEIPF